MADEPQNRFIESEPGGAMSAESPETEEPRQMPTDAAIEGIAAALGKTPAEVRQMFSEKPDGT